MKKLFIYIFLILSISFSAQTATEKIKIAKDKEEPVVFAETQPEYPGGFAEMGKFVSKNIRIPDSIDNAMCVSVHTSFVVNTDGSLSDIKILKCLPDCPPCAEETIRVIKLMPKWKPGISNGKPVAVRFTIPMRFGLK